MKMMVGSTWNAKMKPIVSAPIGPAALDPELAEDELRADEREVQQVVDLAAHPLEEQPAPGRLQHHQSQRELEAQAPQHGLEPNGRAVGRTEIGNRQDDGDAHKGQQSFEHDQTL